MKHIDISSSERFSTIQRILAVICLLATVAVVPAIAGTFNVNTTNDTHAANLTTGQDASGSISLRSAIEAANSQASTAGSPHTINVPSGTYNLTITNANPSATEPNTILIGGATSVGITISGAGSATTIIHQTVAGSGVFENFYPVTGQTITIQNVTISGGIAGGFGGGGILAGGPSNVFNVTNCVISGNSTQSTDNGGGISFSGGGTLNCTNSTFSNNTATAAVGGAIALNNGTNAGNLSISGCTFNGNQATAGAGAGQGGAIMIVLATGSTGNITNSIFTSNSAGTPIGQGGAIYVSSGVVTVSLCRFENNVASSAATALYNNSGTVTAENNWWACDGAPGSAGCQTTAGTVDADPRIDLQLTATPSSIGVGGTSTLFADVSKNTNNTTINPSVMAGLPIKFAGPFGNVNPVLTTINGSLNATSVYTNTTCPGNPSVANTQAEVDNGTQIAPVTVSQPPKLTACPSNISVSNDPGVCGAKVSYTAPADTHGCPQATVTCTPASGATFVIGTTTVTCSAANGVAPNDTCKFTVTVADTQKPVINIITIAPLYNAHDQCGTTATPFSATVTDNCPNATVTCVPPAGSFFQVGTTPDTCTATDENSNVSKLGFVVTVVDSQKPSITCHNDTSVSNEPGLCSAVVHFADPTVSDNCPGVGAPVCSPPSGSAFPKGSTTVTCTVTDAHSNTSICTFHVSVSDTEHPVMSACPKDTSVSTGSPSGAVVTYTAPTATDNCQSELSAVACNPPSGSTFPVGNTKVTCTVSDRTGNQASCSFNIDVVPCTIVCRNDTTIANDPGQCSAMFRYADPTTTGQCGTVTCSPASGTSFPIGATTVRCTSLTTGQFCEFKVTVQDTQKPVVVCPSNMIVQNDHNTCGAVVNYTPATARDNCPLPAPPVCTPPPGTEFPVGPTTVKCVAIDASSNKDSCSFVITVQDTQKPVMTCPPNITGGFPGPNCSAVVSYQIPIAVDNCPGPAVLCTPPSGSSFPAGVTSVTCVATDASSNKDSCSFTVTVNPEADLSIVKTDGVPSVVAGVPDVYTITVDNNGPCEAKNVAVTDLLPSGLTFLSCTSNGGGVCGGSGSNRVVTFASIPAGGTNVIQIGVMVDPGAQGVISNAAIVSSETHDPNPGNNVATDNNTVTPQADLSVTKTGPSTVFVGQNITYSITLHNNGPSDATNVSVNDPLPPGETFFSVSAPPGFSLSTPPVGGTGSIVASVQSLPADSSAVITLVANVSLSNPNGISLTNTAVVITPTQDPNPGNNAGTTTTSVIAQSDLVLTKIAPAGPILTGSNVAYTLTVSNLGPAPAQNAVLVDNTPPGLTLLTVSSSPIGNAQAVPSGVIVQFPSIAPGQTANIEIDAQVNCSLGDGANIINTATVTAQNPDPNLGNNTAGAPITVSNPAPVVTCPGNVVAQNTPGRCDAVVTYPAATATDNCPLNSQPSCSPASGSTFPVGQTTVTCSVTDAGGRSGSCSFTVTVQDTSHPVITGVSATPATLAPPNHKMRDVTIAYTATDNCGTPTCTLSVTSNEPINGTGDGDTSPDWIIIDPHHVQLRAERSSTGNGRIYTVTITCTDASGNVSTQTVNVVVAHNIAGPLSGASFKIGTVVNFAGTFWDIPGNKHTATWTLDGSNATKGIVTEPSGLKNGTATGSFKFTSAGVYKLQMNITDQNGVVTYANTNGDLEAIVVIYDPSGGYTIGGGWYSSPLGALVASPGTTGKVSFGFTSSYFKGATNPKGETQFQLADGNFEFNALNFDYLSISGPKAQFKGSGKVIGDQSGYVFLLTVIDGQATGGGGVDKIRMKIYNKNTNVVIYDNQPGASDAADPTMAVGDGSAITIITTATSSAITGSGTSSASQTASNGTDGQAQSMRVVPGAYGLDQNYPNPFNPVTAISYALPVDSKVRLTIYNTLGETVATLVDEVQSAGYHQATFNASSSPSGLYFYRIDAVDLSDGSRSFNQVKKMLLLK